MNQNMIAALTKVRIVSIPKRVSEALNPPAANGGEKVVIVVSIPKRVSEALNPGALSAQITTDGFQSLKGFQRL